MHTQSWVVAALAGLLLTVMPDANASGAQAPEPVREETVDQQGAAAGEAPPAADQSSRTPADPEQKTGTSGTTPRTGRSAAAEHLDRIEQIVQSALASTKGGAVTMERSQLEEIRMHLGQVRTAVRDASGRKQQP